MRVGTPELELVWFSRDPLPLQVTASRRTHTREGRHRDGCYQLAKQGRICECPGIITFE